MLVLRMLAKVCQHHARSDPYEPNSADLGRPARGNYLNTTTNKSDVSDKLREIMKHEGCYSEDPSTWFGKLIFDVAPIDK